MAKGEENRKSKKEEGQRGTGLTTLKRCGDRAKGFVASKNHFLFKAF